MTILLPNVYPPFKVHAIHSQIINPQINQCQKFKLFLPFLSSYILCKIKHGVNIHHNIVCLYHCRIQLHLCELLKGAAGIIFRPFCQLLTHKELATVAACDVRVREVNILTYFYTCYCCNLLHVSFGLLWLFVKSQKRLKRCKGLLAFMTLEC